MSTNYIDQITDTASTPVTHDIQEATDFRIFRATCNTAASTTDKVATLQDAKNFSLATGVRVAVTFQYGNSATTPTLRVDGSSTGTAKTIAIASSSTAKTTGNGTTYNTWGPYETVIFTYDGTYWVNGGSSLSIYNAYQNIGSDVNVTSTAVTAATTNYLVGSTSSTTATGGLNKHASISAYVDADTSTTGLSRINLGNGTATGTAGAKQGVLRLYGNTAYYCDIRAEGSTPTANRTIYLPSYGGTMYLPCMSTTSAVGSANKPVYVEATGRIVAGNSFVPTTGGTFSGAVTAAASDGTTAQIANVKYGSAAPSGTATNGTVYFQTGSSAYTFQPRINITPSSSPAMPSIGTSSTEITSFTLSAGLYLVTFQVNVGTMSSGNLRVDLIAGTNMITQVRTPTSGGTGSILDGAGLIQCTGNTTIKFVGQTSAATINTCELHYSYVKLF